MQSDIVKLAIQQLETEVAERTMEYNISTPQIVLELLILQNAMKKIEEIGVILLNQSNKVISIEIVAKGIENRCNIHIKDLVRLALDKYATGIIIYHNHPSGSEEFSRQDVALSKQIYQIMELLEIRFVDHILIAGTETISMAKEIGMANLQYR